MADTDKMYTSVAAEKKKMQLLKGQLDGKELTANKVISLSDQSTDAQYPSAKCVYDMIGDVETLLAAI